MKNNFEKFDFVKSPYLRAYNRTVLTMNLQSDFGQDVARSYLEMFDEFERSQIGAIISNILKQGQEETKRQIMAMTTPEGFSEQEGVHAD